MNEKPPPLRGLPPSASRIVLWVLALGLFYNLVVWLWETLAG